MTDSNDSSKYEIIVVGAGPAGLAAALYASRSRIPTLVLERGIPGGQLWNTEDIDDYLGFGLVKGPELAQKMQEHVEKFGAEIETANVTGILSEGDEKVVETDDGTRYRALAVIVTAGGDPRKLGVPGEEELAGKGVSYCAVCDGAFFDGEKIAVVGGGDSAVEESAFLTRYGTKVSIIHRRDEFRAQPILVEQMEATGKVEKVLDTVVEEIVGNDRVSGLKLKNVKTGEKSELEVGAVFPYVGFIPHSDIFKEEIEQDDGNYIVSDEKMATSIPGVFVAGDVRSQYARQISNAVGDATVAALAANAYVNDVKLSRSKTGVG